MIAARLQRSILISTVLLVVIAALVYLGRSPQENMDIARSSDEAANQLRWREGSSQQYDVVVDSSFEMTMPGAGSGQSMAVTTKAALDVRTLQVDADEVLVGMRFSSMEMSVAGATDAVVNQQLTQPFRVRMSGNGLPLSFEFPPTLAAQHREVVENLVRMFQLTIDNGDSWLAQESNSTGNYEAAYRRISASTLIKNKQRYIGSNTSSLDSLPEIVSEETINIGSKSDWIQSMTLKETISNNNPHEPSIVVNNQASIRQRDRPIAGGAVKWNFVSSETPSVSSNQLASAAPAISREEAERRLRAGVNTLDATTEGRSHVIHRLRDLLLIDGEMPSVMLDLIKTEELSDRTRADLYLALELAGSSQAQSALASVFTDQNWSVLDGMRAIVALGGVKKPTEDTLSALWGMAYTAGTGDGRDKLAGSAALALGSIGRELKNDQSSDYFSLRSGLLDAASSAGDSHQRAVFLHALGNTGDPDPSLPNNIVPFLADPQAEVRAAAASTLGRLGSSQVTGQLLQSLEQEQNDVVRSSITEALSMSDSPESTVVESIRAAILDERDENVRYNMAVLLGNSMQEFPQNRKVLEQLLSGEQSKRVRQQVAELLYKNR